MISKLAPSSQQHLPQKTRLLAGLALCALMAAGCSTAGRQAASSAPEELLFDDSQEQAIDREEQPVTEEPESGESTPSTISFDPAVAGEPFDTAEDGPTLAVTGQAGVWWFDANGQAHLVVEPTVAADYDGAGGLVFQRSPSSPIVRRSAEAQENDIVAAGEGEELRLVGVADVAGVNEVIYLRVSDEETRLERATLDAGLTSKIADVRQDGADPTRLSISGGYVSGVYLSGSGAGWTTISTTSGSKLFGTAQASLGACDDRDTNCTEAVTVSPDGSSVYQVVVGEDRDEWDLVLNSSSNFAELARVSLQRPDGGWHTKRVETIAGKVVVSRSANADGTGDLPALVIDPASGEITQLDRSGTAVAITG